MEMKELLTKRSEKLSRLIPINIDGKEQTFLNKISSVLSNVSHVVSLKENKHTMTRFCPTSWQDAMISFSSMSVISWCMGSMSLFSLESRSAMEDSMVESRTSSQSESTDTFPEASLMLPCKSSSSDISMISSRAFLLEIPGWMPTADARVSGCVFLGSIRLKKLIYSSNVNSVYLTSCDRCVHEPHPLNEHG